MTTAHMSLDQRVRQVHLLRTELAERKASVKQLREEWESKHSPILATVRNAEVRLGEHETELRQAVLRDYGVTGEKKPTPGVEVKIFETLAYEDADAFAWANEHGIALSLDKRVFEGIAKGAAGNDMDFVTKGDEARVQIAQDLNKHLP